MFGMFTRSRPSVPSSHFLSHFLIIVLLTQYSDTKEFSREYQLHRNGFFRLQTSFVFPVSLQRVVGSDQGQTKDQMYNPYKRCGALSRALRSANMLTPRQLHTNGLRPLVLEPLTAALVEPAARTVAVSMSSANALVRAVGSSAEDLLPWARGAINRSMQRGISFALTDRNPLDNAVSVASVLAGHVSPSELPPAPEFEAFVATLPPAVAVYPHFVRELSIVAYQQIQAAAPVVFGCNEPYTIVYSGPAATAPEYFGRRVARVLADQHYGRIAALTGASDVGDGSGEHVALWVINADPASAGIIRRKLAAASVGLQGAILPARLADMKGPALSDPAYEPQLTRLLAAYSESGGLQTSLPDSTPLDDARAAPLENWLLGRLSPSPCSSHGIVYAIKRVALTFRHIGHLHPNIAALGDNAPIELTVVLMLRPSRLCQ
jgi:hypothetical protein